MNIKSKRLSEITPEDIFDYHGAISTKTTYTANRMVRLIRKYYNFASRKNFLKMRKDLADHPIEKVGAELRAMMPWIGKKKLIDSDKK